jgi:hypothetical protein
MKTETKPTAPRSVADDERVRMGAMSPSFPTPRAVPVVTKDGGKVRMGAMSPSFPPNR